jgi:Domain of unknown function (DUF222)
VASRIFDHMFDTVVRCGDQLAGVIARLDPDALSGQTAQSWWYALDRVERLAGGGKTLLARRLAATHSPLRSGQKSAAETMARDAGTSVGAAKDALNTSERLPELGKVEAALRRGDLSPAQAALISDAAAADPPAQDRLLALASKGSVPELREECARVKAAADPDPEATNRRLHHQRRLRRWTDAEGFWNLHAKGTPQAGAAFNAVFDQIVERFFTAARADRRREPVEAYAFDALMHLAEHAAGRCDCHDQPAPTDSDAAGTPGGEAADPNTSGNGDATGGTPEGGHDEQSADPPEESSAGEDATVGAFPARFGGTPLADGREPDTLAAAAGSPGIFTAAAAQQSGPVCRVGPQQSVNPRFLALLRVDVEALRRGHVAGEELCQIDGVGPVPVSIARDLLGEAILKLVITKGVDVLNVTHLGRGPTAAQRAALLWINPTCAVEGCNRRRIEWDHREDWATTRHTRLDELDGLCDFHHDLKTRCGWALVPGAGKRLFVPPDDPKHPRNQKSADVSTGGDAVPAAAPTRVGGRRARLPRRNPGRACAPGRPPPPPDH